MLGLSRITVAFCAVLVAGVAGVAALPGHSRTPARPGLPYARFQADGGFIVAPRGWSLLDPFTTTTPYLGRLWLEGMPSRQARVALIKLADSSAEVFLMFGPRAALAPVLKRGAERFRDAAGVEELPVRELATAEGVPIACRIALERDAGGAETRYLLATAEVGDSLLVVNGGGQQAALDVEAICAMLHSVRLPR